MDFGRTTSTATADNLIAGEFPRIGEVITLLSGEGALVLGQLLGKVIRALGAITADAGNTGDGTCAAASLGAKAQLGTYTLECVATAADGGTFAVFAPDGARLADALVGAAYSGPQVNFTISDGAADFVLGDKFTIAVDAGSGKYRAVNAANVDGSAEPVAVLAQAADATSADKAAPAYFTGEFFASGLTGYTAAMKDALRARGVHVRN